MTKAELIQKSSEMLEDEGLIHFTRTDFNDSFQDGYELTALLSTCIEKSTTIQTVANQPYYDFNSLIPDYYKVFAIWNDLTKRWLDPKTYKEFAEWSSRWEAITGNPRWFSILGHKHIVLHPTPISVMNLIIFYHAVPVTELTDSQLPEIRLADQIMLSYYMTGDLLIQNLEYIKSEHYLNEFSASAKHLRQEWDKRSQPDKILYLMDQHP